MNIETLIKDYLKNKAAFDSDIKEKINSLDGDIKRQRDEMPVLPEDVALSSTSIAQAIKTSNASDVSCALVRYEDMKREYYEESLLLINKKIEYLNTLILRKRIYENISFLTYTLAPLERMAVTIYMGGGKIAEIASELRCSYNTAREYLNAGFCAIREGIDEELVESCPLQ